MWREPKGGIHAHATATCSNIGAAANTASTQINIRMWVRMFNISNNFLWTFWKEYRYSADESQPTFFSHRLLNTKFICIELHKFTGIDAPECFHTHPALALRIGLRGGYIELDIDKGFRCFRAGDIGLVRPSTCHRVAHLLMRAPAYTLWIRGPKVSDIKLIGSGWKHANWRK